MRIKELYGCEYECSKEELYPLQKWYNRLIDKSIQEITPEDAAKMLRQEIFPDLAMTKAIEFLQEDPFAGELQDVLSDVPQKMAAHEWLYDGEEGEFREIVDAVACKTANS